MSETVDTASSGATSGRNESNGRKARQRLRYERVYTTPGVHPYDAVTWERRDVIMTNWRDGSINFEQRGVEFPDFWSVNAANIVTTKYFRGAVGTEDREWSIRQVIDRVVDTYVAAGQEHGYFVSDEDTEIFDHELKHMLLHQIFSFNSPVWFNVGTAAPQQVSACFILAVDDTMTSILNWYAEEGIIFKGGSGAGLNLSRIRSSKELLSSGGTASGPVSFMRGADASAGTIKSGGATRRAAKMVILDVDHPDIEEFIQTKAREEDKIRALRDAGFDMDLGGKDIVSVQYQNANNSVRVNDEFMRAVEHGQPFGLRGRKTGEVMETVDARELFRKISTAAWECADPGLQYDGTINDWHTCPETGRITASNPCSEYMHLDNSSCNLASLNLMKFHRVDGTFDIATFAKAVEYVITAMDISICFADFPTQAIGETTRAYRQLGIGYANLGALLMADGVAYDSDQGRAMAGAITSLMQATAYKRSAEIAALVGPYDGYARNAEPHKRVIRKHAAANDALRPLGADDARILHEATKTWQSCIALGDAFGYRNSQASVIAPTGCLVGDTLVASDRGLARLQELGEQFGPKWQDLDLTVSTDEGPRAATKFFVNGEEETRRIVTEGGYRIQGTLTHRIKVIDSATGVWEWKRLSAVAAGDVVPLQMGTLIGDPRPVALPVLDQAYYAGDRGIVVPDHLDADLAELVGYFMGDGSLHAKGIRICVADTDPDLVERFRILGKGLFNLEPDVTAQAGYHELTYSSVRLARWWQAAGFAKLLPSDDHVGKGWTPRVPAAVLESNDASIYAAFVRGLFEADGTVSSGVPSFSTASASFAYEVQTVLLAIGMPTTLRETASGSGGPQFQLRIRNIKHALRFADHIGFLSDRKLSLLAAVAATKGVSHDLTEPMPDGNADPRPSLALGYIFEVIASNEDGGVQPTFDLSVPDNVTYVAGGFVSHNTIGLMMDCDTTGLEPDLALVKMKKLVGGASMKIVNQTVPMALRKLGYSEETVEAIVEYIAEYGHVVDAPGLKSEHYTVFDCAMGERSISWMGHIRMMAAIQPFISGALSKTVNLPASATVEDVEKAYFESWKLGLKAVAIYRDMCKVGQPLSDLRATEKAAGVAAAAGAAAIEPRPLRKRLPKNRRGETVSFSVGGAEGYMTANAYEDGRLGEVFIKMSKQGSTLAGVMDAYSIAISIALQYGVPLETYVSKFMNMRFDPAGLTDDADVRIAQSVMDYIFRRLALDFLPFEKRAELGIYTAAERAAAVAGGTYAPTETATEGLDDVEVDVEGLAQGVPVQTPPRASATPMAMPGSTAELIEMQQGTAADAPMCFNCGTKMRPAGSCYVCEGCGSTSGCS